MRNRLVEAFLCFFQFEGFVFFLLLQFGLYRSSIVNFQSAQSIYDMKKEGQFRRNKDDGNPCGHLNESGVDLLTL